MIEVELSDGRVLEIETDDPAVAAAAGKKFLGGATAAPSAPPDMNLGETAMDVGLSGGIGLSKAGIGLAGMGADARELNASLLSKGANALGMPVSPETISSVLRFLPGMGGKTSQQLQSIIEGATGEFYKPRSMAGEFAQTAGEFAPGVIAGPGGIGRRVVTQVVAPALLGEAAAQATKGTDYEPYAKAGAAFAAPTVVSGLRRAITPLPVAPGRQAQVNTLLAEGVMPTAGQRAGSKAVQYAESTLGDYPFAGNRASAASELSQTQFTRAALRRIGMDAEPTPQNVDIAVQRIQDTFERLSRTHTLNYDRQFATDITQTLQRYGRKMPSQQREIVQNYIDDFRNFPGQMPGDVYQIARSDLSRQANALRNSDPTLSGALRGLRNALDGAMNRSLSPAARAEWQTARRQWANWRTLQNAAKNTDAQGNVRITPAGLANSAAARERGSFARGLGDFNALARAGQSILTPLPQSGTTPRAVATGLAGLLGGTMGVLPGIAALAAPPAAGRALMSPWAQQYLSNQLMAAPMQNQLASGGINALLASLGGPRLLPQQ